MSPDHVSVRRRDFLLGLTASAALGASIAPSEAQSGNSGAAKRAPTRTPSTKKFGLVLGSGSARGFAHIGVIKALDEAKLRPDLVVGSSAGALVGAFFASGLSGVQMEETAMRVKDIDIVDFETGSKRGMVVGDSLQRFVNMATRGKPIEALPIQFAAVATQLRSGEIAVLRSGDTGLAVRASCSVPGVFIPPRIGEIEYVDGALVSPVPVRAARELGAELTVAVDVSSAPINASPMGTYEQVMHSFEIMGRSLATLESSQADIVIRPDVRRISSTDFASRAALIAIGYAAGQRFAPVIREKLDQMRARKA
jgi:NTE family protein